MTGSDDPVSVEPADRPPIDPELVDRFVEQAGEGVELLGPDGLLSELTKSVLEHTVLLLFEVGIVSHFEGLDA